MKASMIVLIVIVAIIAVYRWIVADHGDESPYIDDVFLDLEDPPGQPVTNQEDTPRVPTWVDHLAIGLTVLPGLYGISLLGMFLYSGLK